MDATIIGVLSGIGGTLVAVAGVILAWFLGRRAERTAASQHRLNAAIYANEWFRDLRTWAFEAIDLLSETAAVVEADQHGTEINASVWHYRHKLSALIDRGRFFLPNVRSTDYGTHKPTAFRGFRHSALDPLVAVIRVLDGDLGRFQSRKEAILAMKREFVSAVQRILDPAAHNKEIATLIRKTQPSRAEDPTHGGLLPDSIPLGAEPLLEGKPFSKPGTD